MGKDTKLTRVQLLLGTETENVKLGYYRIRCVFVQRRVVFFGIIDGGCSVL
jgi:hypothetical protein